MPCCARTCRTGSFRRVSGVKRHGLCMQGGGAYSSVGRPPCLTLRRAPACARGAAGGDCCHPPEERARRASSRLLGEAGSCGSAAATGAQYGIPAKPGAEGSGLQDPRGTRLGFRWAGWHLERGQAAVGLGLRKQAVHGSQLVHQGFHKVQEETGRRLCLFLEPNLQQQPDELHGAVQQNRPRHAVAALKVQEWLVAKEAPDNLRLNLRSSLRKVRLRAEKEVAGRTGHLVCWEGSGQEQQDPRARPKV